MRTGGFRRKRETAAQIVVSSFGIIPHLWVGGWVGGGRQECVRSLLRSFVRSLTERTKEPF